MNSTPPNTLSNLDRILEMVIPIVAIAMTTAYGFNGQIVLFAAAAALLAVLLTVQWQKYRSTRSLIPDVNGEFAK